MTDSKETPHHFCDYEFCGTKFECPTERKVKARDPQTGKSTEATYCDCDQIIQRIKKDNFEITRLVFYCCEDHMDIDTGVEEGDPHMGDLFLD